MQKVLTLGEYVKKRNGVAIGGSGSMSNMLKRSIGAGSFDVFWQYWNPIWGYYLNKKVMKPLSRVFPVWLAIIMTFFVSGFLHDVAITLVRREITVVFTTWFTLMSFAVVATKAFNISYRTQHWVVRSAINLTIIVGSFMITRQFV